MTTSHPLFPILSKFLRFSLIVILLAACTPGATDATLTPTAPTTPTSSIPAAQTIVEPHNELLAQVTFEVDAPANSPSGQSLYFELLDEVTGLALNSVRYQMESKGNNHYTIQVPIPIGSMVKYRYGRSGASSTAEFSPTGSQVRYRLLQVQGPTVVKDIIGGWQDLPFDGKFGRITGQITDAHTNAPLPNIMVSAGGIQTFTASDGTYIIEGLPAGVHNLVAYSLDGSYQPYQQGAQVSVDMATPAPIHLNPAALVDVTFVTHAPKDSVRGIPIRIMGNILSLGNTFADLGGGVSTLASRAPLMALQPDGSYTLTLTLPAGLDLRYKYSSGDGFWNAEHNADGSFNVRQFIIPDMNVTVDDTIDTWQTKDSGAVTFTVTVPDTTPAGDTVSIQFNPYGWTEPIPMWPLGNHQWLFVLYSPLQLVSNIGYRYCRNDQCSVADDAASMGANSSGKIITSTRTNQSMVDVVKNWAYLETGGTPTTVVAQDIKPRGSSFMAGVEFSSQYRPSWQPYLSAGLDNVKQMGANWVVFDPTWTAARANPPVIEPVTGKDAYWQDLIQMMVWAQDKDLNIALYPQLNFDPSFATWWNSTRPDASWWQSWFDRYSSYILDHASLAAQINAGVLILGDPGISPSLPGGKLPNGVSANPPANADKRWSNLIADVRARYKGKIAWALPYTGTLTDAPSFLSDVDEIYVLWSAPVVVPTGATTNSIAADMGKELDQDILTLKNTLNKPVVLGIDYPSMTGVARGCAMVDSQCVSFDSLDVETARTAITPDLTEQATLYNAFLVALNQRAWIDGFVSRGFYPPATLQDFTPSVHGKPASDILWYWYPRLLASPGG